MDQGIVEQVLDELIPSFEALETQSAAVAQLLKDRGIAKDDQLAPYLEQAKSSSSIRWRATRLRMERILSSTTKTTEESTKQVAAEPKEKASPKPEEEARGQTPSAELKKVRGKEQKKESEQPEETAKTKDKDRIASTERSDSDAGTNIGGMHESESASRRKRA
ncbi:MAG: hypothetical protein DMG97_07515 [Acidobacteria bacterium]|nr:MAG: hypothetical protein DMG98_01030 [Acidobacteriota bacterium]PYV74937.1 MAG: hypothetical protein DMG97_07515 [Acidobacteriota bacterium]